MTDDEFSDIPPEPEDLPGLLDLTARAGTHHSAPRYVAETFRYLGHLFGAAIERGPQSVRGFAARHCGVHDSEVVTATEHLSALSYRLVGRVVAREIEAHDGVVVRGVDDDEPPKWERLDLDGKTEMVPSSLAAAFPAGTLSPRPLVIELDYSFQDLTLQVFTAMDDVDAGQAVLLELLERARGGDNPYRGRVLETVYDPDKGLSFEVRTPPDASRERLILPQDLWDEIDLNVHGLFANLPRLEAADLGTNRGVLLAGPPGVGKTWLCKVLANELAGEVTVIFAGSRIVMTSVQALYREVGALAPALVVIEDIDLLVPNRESSAATGVLQEFLVALDGAMTNHSGVVTVATTNAVNAIDDAAKRAARFDRVLDVPPPVHEARRTILARYVEPLGIDTTIDFDRVAAMTDGASGADLRELVRLAVLHTDGAVTTEVLCDLARKGGWIRNPTGLYL